GGEGGVEMGCRHYSGALTRPGKNLSLDLTRSPVSPLFEDGSDVGQRQACLVNQSRILAGICDVQPVRWIPRNRFDLVSEGELLMEHSIHCLVHVGTLEYLLVGDPLVGSARLPKGDCARGL